MVSCKNGHSGLHFCVVAQITCTRMGARRAQCCVYQGETLCVSGHVQAPLSCVLLLFDGCRASSCGSFLGPYSSYPTLLSWEVQALAFVHAYALHVRVRMSKLHFTLLSQTCSHQLTKAKT